jgi:hypothetical protein
MDIYSWSPLVSHAPIQFAVFPALLPRFGTGALGTLLALALVTACGSDLVLPGDDTSSASAIRVLDGDGQSGEVGEMLESPLVVEVTDAAGDPVPGATVVFQLTSAGEGGEISPSPTTTTDSSGRAEAHIVLGDKVGLQTGAAHVVVGSEAGPQATFSALATLEKPEKDHDQDDDDDD